MPIREYLDGRQFDSETIRVMGLAFEMTRAALHADGRNSAINTAIAEKIVALVQAGEPVNQDHLCERTIAFVKTLKYDQM